MSSSDVTRDGVHGAAPDRDARIGQLSEPGPRRRRDSAIDSMVGRADFRSYYGLPVLNRPTWAAADIAGYLFAGGLAGASSTLAAAAQLTGRPGLARPLRFGAAGAITFSMAALVHDLGRPSRFYNMLRVFKPTSPMSVGSWILAAYGPVTIGAAALTSPLPLPWSAAARAQLATGATLAAGVVGPAVAAYTGVLLADTAVPAWHGAHRELPLMFVSSAASAAGGFGLATAPLRQSGPARRLGVAGAAAELAVGRIMRRRLGLVAEAHETGRAGRLGRAAELATAAGAVAAVAGRRSRVASAAAGAALLVGSALTRFSVFYAGVASAEDPKYTVLPQRQGLDPSR